MAEKSGGARRHTFVTSQQQRIHDLFVKHRSMSTVARKLGLTQIRVREALVQVQRNQMRDAGIRPPPLREMMRGDVTVRFGVSRAEYGGRPAKHEQDDPMIAGPVQDLGGVDVTPVIEATARPEVGVRRMIVTAAEAGAPVHAAFWRNLRAYAARIGAEIAVLRVGAVGLVGDGAPGLRQLVRTERMEMAGVVDIAADIHPAPQSPRPLDGLRRRGRAQWMVVGHPSVQLETQPRVRADGLRVHISSGAVTMPRTHSGMQSRLELGAAVVEVRSDGHAHCRHVLADVHGDGSFQDLRFRVKNGVVSDGCRTEALVFGDVHQIHMDGAVAAATWGIGRGPVGTEPLVDTLRPRLMVYHDLCDFEARNHHDSRDHHKRFAQMVSGGGDVRAELQAASNFLEVTRRSWSQSVVVSSNHDAALVRWLRESDYREDGINAIFHLETALALYRRLRDGKSTDGMFEHVLRRLSSDGLQQVRFLVPGESFRIAGIEHAIHGHQGADGKRGSMPAFERLGIRATLGHTHRPTTRDGIYSVGVCQTELEYARGPLSSWAVGHVATYSTGARQHLIFNGGRFFA